MGYRSDVAIAFYPADAESKGVVTLWLKENLPFDTWNVDEYWLIDEAQGSYIFRAMGIRYSSYVLENDSFSNLSISDAAKAITSP